MAITGLGNFPLRSAWLSELQSAGVYHPVSLLYRDRATDTPAPWTDWFFDAPAAGGSVSWAALDFDDEAIVMMRKNVAGQLIAGQVNDRTTGAPLSSSVSVFVTGDGGTQGAGGGTLTHEGNGHWGYAPTQAETNFNHVAFTFTHASGVHKTYNVYPVSFDPTDAAGLGLTRLDEAVSSRLATAGYTAPDNATIASILADTDNIQTRLPAALVSGRMASIAEVVGDKTGYALTQTFPPNFAAQSITAAGLVDITQAAADKAWGTGTRVLTAGTNIALAKGTGVTGFTDIDASGVRAAVGLASANLDTQLGAMPTLAQLNAEIDAVQTDIAGVLSDTNDIQTRLPAALVGGRMDASVGALATGSLAAIADEVLGYAVEAGLTTKQALRLMAAALAGKISGASGTTITIKNAVADNKDRIVATVDSDGNRTAITYDLAD